MSISPSAQVSNSAKVGQGVQIGPFSIVHDDVVIGDNVTIESHCDIGTPTALAQGRPLVIGDRSLIRSHSVFYQGSQFGPGLRTGNHVTVREMLTAGPGLQIGTLSDFQGHCKIGDYVRTHSNVHIGHNSLIGSYVWIFPFAVLTNDPHPPSDGFLTGVVVEDFAVITTMCTIMPGVRIGTRSLVAAHSLVNRDVPADMVVGGVPAKVLCPTSSIKLRDESGQAAYPWMRHFHRGYPNEVVDAWLRNYSGPERTSQPSISDT